MRKTALLLVALMSVWGATSWQSQRQWKVIRDVTLENQTQGIQQTTLFTPAQPGVYRYSIYMSGTGETGLWTVSINYNDLSGLPTNITTQIGPFSTDANAMYSALPVAPFSVERGVPVTFTTYGYGPATYNLGITIEKLE